VAFDLAIGLWIVDRCATLRKAAVSKEALELIADELTAIV
jgi:hypothetical protein